jgi:hypothetical protein
MKGKLFMAAAMLVAAFSSAVHAEGTAFFTVNGKITQGTGTDGKKTYVFDHAAFDKLPQTTVRTSTSWTDGVHAFKGPLLRDVLKTVGAPQNADLEAFAIDDYMSRIPGADAAKYDVIVAETMDDKPLPMDKFGPLWIVYPRDQFPNELKNPSTDGKFAWQLYRLSVK